MIQKVFTLIVLLSLQLFAHQYDDTLLAIEAKLFPKIAMLEKSVANKKSSELRIVIYSQDIDEAIATKLRSKILFNYPDTLLNKKLKVTLAQRFDELTTDTDCIIVLSQEEDKVTKLASWAHKNHILTFSYDASYLQYGILGSIYLGKATKPYLNALVIRDYGFVFDTHLLQLCKLYVP